MPLVWHSGIRSGEKERRLCFEPVFADTAQQLDLPELEKRLAIDTLLLTRNIQRNVVERRKWHNCPGIGGKRDVGDNNIIRATPLICAAAAVIVANVETGLQKASDMGLEAKETVERIGVAFQLRTAKIGVQRSRRVIAELGYPDVQLVLLVQAPRDEFEAGYDLACRIENNSDRYWPRSPGGACRSARTDHGR